MEKRSTTRNARRVGLSVRSALLHTRQLLAAGWALCFTGARSCAAFAQLPNVDFSVGALPVFVRANNGTAEENRHSPLDPVVLRKGADKCGSSEELACPNIRSALDAIPAHLPAGVWPELRLLPGVYTGDDNVFLGRADDTSYPASARNVTIMGVRSSGTHPTSESPVALASERVTLSCQGRWHSAATTSASRGLWLSEDRITRLAHLTVRECAAGGVGVDAWAGSGSSWSQASLSFVSLLDNGSEDCDAGGGLYVETQSTSKLKRRGELKDDLAAVVTVFSCVLANNSAHLGGGVGARSVSGADVSFLEAKQAEGVALRDMQRDHNRLDSSDGAGASKSPVLRIEIDGATTVEKNRAAFGGGLWAAGASISAGGDTLVMEENVATGPTNGCREEARDEFATGGGLAVRNAAVDAVWCSFVENSATAVVGNSAGIGGGVYLDGSNATLDGCHFERNRAGGDVLFGQLSSHGGGMATRGPSVVTRISESTFLGNAAGRGGSGGGIWIEDGATAVLVNTSLINNTAASSYTTSGTGGGIAASSSARLRMTSGCVLDGNSAGPEDVRPSDPPCFSGEGGAVHAFGSDITMDGVILKRNRCGTGALDAGCQGGAVSLTGQGPSPSPASPPGTGALTFRECVFEDNEARGATTSSVYIGAARGGAVAIRFAFPSFTGCKFIRNSAQAGGGSAPATGGAVFMFFSRVVEAPLHNNGNEPPTFAECLFESNCAGAGCGHVAVNGKASPEDGHGVGGALAAIASTPSLESCTFRDNLALAVLPSSDGRSAGPYPVSTASPSFGGAIMLTRDCAGTKLVQCELERNRAVNGVGGDLAVLAPPSKGSSGGHPASLDSVMYWSAATTTTAEDPTPSRRTPPYEYFTPSVATSTAQSNDAGDAGVRLLRCFFSPASAQTNPPVPWADGNSETEASPFLFILDGGTIELDSPVFNASGQAFVSQIDSKHPVSLGGGNESARVRITDGSGSPDARLSIVSIGGKVSLSEQDVSGDTGAPVNKKPPLALEELASLRAEVTINTASSNGRSTRGIRVAGSARLRASTLRGGSSSVGPGWRASGQDEPCSVVCVQGDAEIGEAWHPKPFFLGTSLAQVIGVPPRWDHEASGADVSAPFKGHEAVSLDGIFLELAGKSTVHGDVSLVGQSRVQILAEGKLTLAGDTSLAQAGDAEGWLSRQNPVLLNSGTLSLPRGLSLTIDGGIEQHSSGSTWVALPSPLYSPTPCSSPGDGLGIHPLVIVSGGSRLSGAVNASTAGRGGDAERIKMNRKWALVRFASLDAASNASMGGLALRGPPGVSMEMSMQRMADKDHEYLDQWELVLEAAFIACDKMLAYANMSLAGGPCQACLLNMECAWCGAGGGCVPLEDRPVKLGSRRRSDGVCQVGNCCPFDCNGVGRCDFTSATCSCPWLYAGSSCKELSTKGAVTLSLSLSAVLILLLTIACGRSSRRKQMEAVVGTLQELRKGLLADTEGSLVDDDGSVASFGSGVRRSTFSIGGRGHLPGSGSVARSTGGGSSPSYQHMWPRDYIQNLQQNLALRDVMVAFSELEISRKIGSGAAGSVWRGMWRGAAVAIKVIRRPFHQAVELTGHDLDVFKREAYLMTRLRHPNIVLIMGVTFAPPGHRITLDGQGFVSLSRRRELGFDNSGAEQGSLCIVTELLSRGSLEDVIRRGGLRTASYGLILHLARQAARGMLYLHTHSPPIVHRDLKSSNLVVDEHWHVKVTDFGMSRFIPEPLPKLPTSATPSSAASGATSVPGKDAVSSSSGKVLDSEGDPLSTPRGEGVEEEKGGQEYLEEASFDGSENEGDDGGSAEATSSWGLMGTIPWGRASRTSGHGIRGDVATTMTAASAASGAGQGELGLTTNLGTVAWAAPEMLSGGEGGRAEYTAKVDVYSFGVVLWELWERRRPFEELRSRFDIADTVVAGGRPPIGRGCPPPFADLIRRCWHQDPTRRPLFQDIVDDLESELGSLESLTEL